MSTSVPAERTSSTNTTKPQVETAGTSGAQSPDSTQWDIVSDAAKTVEPIYEELIRQAAQGEVLHNDDTTMRIRSFTRCDGDSRARRRHDPPPIPQVAVES